ncbi:MAG: flagellar protein FlgN [Candidatus Thiodiazotropha sp.]|jgi:flagellar biosynthesis protein FlgN
MPDTTQHQEIFSKILNTEIEQTQSLLKLLRQEYEHLKGTPSKTLEELVERKNQLLLQINQSISKHNQLLLSQGYSADRKGTEDFIQQCPNKEQLDEHWSLFSSLLKACQKQNEIIGGAVKLNHHQVTQALDILRGIAGSNKTYGPGGEARPNTTSKSLGKA